MAEIRDLSGKHIEPEEIGRDPKIAELLEEFVDKNRKGRLRSIMVVYLTPEGWYGSSWAWGAGAGAEVGLLGLGALEALKGELLAKMREMPEVPDEGV